MVTYKSEDPDIIWKALCDKRRRAIVEALSEGPKLTGSLVSLFPDIGRTAVLKHIDILASADLIRVTREGRKRWNTLNPEPVKQVCSPWISRHIDGLNASANALKSLAEMQLEPKDT